MPNIGINELLIILVIVLLIFGVGRVSKIGGELGKAFREFRRGLSGDEEPKPKDDEEKKETK